ncbi:MAG: hypothetical protein M5U14_03580 [Acidimicrobiia bacterium]|nr:hypothetical protein [Acidimicrobiia bacterium]
MAEIVEAVKASDMTSAVPSDRYDVEDVRFATSDPTWASAWIVPHPGVTVDGAYVVLHREGDTWVLVDIGTSGVGCIDPPPDVVDELGLECF